MNTTLFCVVTQQVVAIPYRRFRTTYRSHLRGPRIQERHIFEKVRKLQNFLEIHPVGAALIQADRRTDMTMLISAF